MYGSLHTVSKLSRSTWEGWLVDVAHMELVLSSLTLKQYKRTRKVVIEPQVLVAFAYAEVCFFQGMLVQKK